MTRSVVVVSVAQEHPSAPQRLRIVEPIAEPVRTNDTNVSRWVISFRMYLRKGDISSERGPLANLTRLISGFAEKILLKKVLLAFYLKKNHQDCWSTTIWCPIVKAAWGFCVTFELVSSWDVVSTQVHFAEFETRPQAFTFAVDPVSELPGMVNMTYLEVDSNRPPSEGARKHYFCKWYSRLPLTNDKDPLGGQGAYPSSLSNKKMFLAIFLFVLYQICKSK